MVFRDPTWEADYKVLSTLSEYGYTMIVDPTFKFHRYNMFSNIAIGDNIGKFIQEQWKNNGVALENNTFPTIERMVSTPTSDHVAPLVTFEFRVPTYMKDNIGEVISSKIVTKYNRPELVVEVIKDSPVCQRYYDIMHRIGDKNLGQALDL